MSKKKKLKVEVKKVFNYKSECCGELATKPALVRTEEAQGTLGHWSCSKCNNGCKVKRSRVKDERHQDAGTNS